jgi:hypothetical protein
VSAFPTDTAEHLACVALDLATGNTMLAIERLEQAAAVLEHLKRTAIYEGDVIPDDA